MGGYCSITTNLCGFLFPIKLLFRCCLHTFTLVSLSALATTTSNMPLFVLHSHCFLTILINRDKYLSPWYADDCSITK